MRTGAEVAVPHEETLAGLEWSMGAVLLYCERKSVQAKREG